MKRYGTFNEWSKAGYMIIKGSKALFKDNANESYFSEDQVTKKKITYRSPISRSYFDPSDCDEFCNGDLSAFDIGADF